MTTPVSDSSLPPSDSHSVSACQESVTPSQATDHFPLLHQNHSFHIHILFRPTVTTIKPTSPTHPLSCTPQPPHHSPPLPSDNQLEAAVRRVLGISSVPTSSTVTPPTGITSQSTTSGKCHQYVYLLPLPLLQWQSLLLAYHWLSSQPPTGSSSSFLSVTPYL